MKHIKPERLFDLSQADPREKDSQLEDWEKQHLQECDACQRLFQVLARQFGRREPPPIRTEW